MSEKVSQEKIIRKHMVKLIKLTRNLERLLRKLVEYDVLDEDQVQQINLCSDDETSFNLLYELTISKLPECFDLLIYALRDTDNERLASLIEDSVNYGDENVRRLRRESSTERYSKPETRALSITGAEMGVAEFLEDYQELKDIESLIKVFSLEEESDSIMKKIHGRQSNFVFSATLVLREWSEIMGPKANVVMLCSILETRGFKEAADRIRRMFDNYVDSGFAFDFPGKFTIEGKVEKISEILNANPSFCLYPERLYVMLGLPLFEINDFIKENNFMKNCNKMLIQWTKDNPEGSSIDHLASSLALNGHFCTAEKISNL